MGVVTHTGWRDEFERAVAQALVEVRAELAELQDSAQQRRRWQDVAAAAARPPSVERLQEVLRVALAEVPFYAALNRHLGDVPPSLSDFPILRKGDLRQHFADLIRRDPVDSSLPQSQYFLVRTSGSTGRPVSTLKSAGEDGWADAVLRERLYREHGVPERGEVFDVGLHPFDAPLVELRVDTRPWLAWNLRLYEADSAEVTAEYDVVFRRRRPVLVQGVTSRIVTLARLARAEGRELCPALAVCSFEQLTESARGVIEEVFHCPAVSLYGTSETGIAGWECREHRMHFELDAVVPEVVDDRGSPVAPGETGGLLLTSLKSTVMPIIRYDTGDMAQLPARPCPCGRRGPSIGALEGRAGLVLVGRSGRTQPPYLLMSLIDELGVGDFQLVQDVPGTVRLVVAAGSPVAEELPERVVAGLRERSRDDLDIRLDRTGGFVLSPSGKRETVVSRIGPAAAS